MVRTRIGLRFVLADSKTGNVACIGNESCVAQSTLGESVRELSKESVFTNGPVLLGHRATVTSLLAW